MMNCTALQEPCAWDRKATVSVHIFEMFICAKFCLRVLAISCLSKLCGYSQERINKVYAVRKNFRTIKISDA